MSQRKTMKTVITPGKKSVYHHENIAYQKNNKFSPECTLSLHYVCGIANCM